MNWKHRMAWAGGHEGIESLDRLIFLGFPTKTSGQGLSHPLLKFSGGSGDDYATIPDDSSSPS